MLNKDEFLPFGFLKSGGRLTGDHKGMRYFLVKKTEETEVDGEKKSETFLAAYVWPEPFSFDKTSPEKITEKRFELSPDGRLEAIDWVISQYDSRRDEWDNIPNLTEIIKNL